jgi:hypothetical protein
MGKLVIFGTGDIARLAHHYFTRDTDHEVVAFTVDRQYRRENRFLDLRSETIASLQRTSWSRAMCGGVAPSETRWRRRPWVHLS